MLRRFFDRAEEGFIALLLAAMTLLTFTQVVLRYVFNSGFIWALEATTYLFGWLVLFGISYGVRVNAHIGIDLLVKAFPVRARRLLGLVAIALCLVYACLMAYGSYVYIDRIMTLGLPGEDIPLPRWLMSIILPIGFVLLGIRLLERAIDILAGRTSGFEIADEARDILKEQGLIGERIDGERRS